MSRMPFWLTLIIAAVLAADSSGWGWGAFKYDAASGKFTPATTSDILPQGNDAQRGLGCHTIVKTRDYVFTDYGPR